jgi:hypothetical protein
MAASITTTLTVTAGTTAAAGAGELRRECKQRPRSASADAAGAFLRFGASHELTITKKPG